MPLQPFGGGGMDPMDLLKLGLQNRSQQMQMLQMVQQRQQHEQDLAQRQAVLAQTQAEAQRKAEAERIAQERQQNMAKAATDIWAQESGTSIMNPAYNTAQTYMQGATPEQIMAELKHQRSLNDPTNLQILDTTEGKFLVGFDPRTRQPVKYNLNLSANPKDMSDLEQDDWTIANWETGKTPKSEFNRIKYELAKERYLQKVTDVVTTTTVNPDTSSRQQVRAIRPGLAGMGGGGAQGTVLAEGEKARAMWSPPVRAQMEKRLAENNQALMQLDSLKQNYKPEFLTYQGSFEAWSKNKYNKVDPAYYDEFTKEKNEFNSQVEVFFQKYLRQPITGAQAAQVELEQLKQDLVNKKMSPMQFVAAVTAMTKMLQTDNQGILSAFEAGPTSYQSQVQGDSWWQGAAPMMGGQPPGLTDDEIQEIINQARGQQ